MILPPAAPEPPPAPTPPPVWESGPVAYEEPAEEEENEEEAEDSCISAMELIGGNGQYVTSDCSRVTDKDNEVTAQGFSDQEFPRLVPRSDSSF